MKQLHRPDMFGWSVFDPERNLDFHSLAWIRPAGNVLVDPLPLDAHDAAHLTALGGARHVVVTNRDHVRAAAAAAGGFGAELLGPIAERETLGLVCDRWIGGTDAEEPIEGLHVYAMLGSKTAGELALLLDRRTLVTGDLVRGQVGGRLNLLPDARLTDRQAAMASLRRLCGIDSVQAVLVGDGWHVFRDGRSALLELLARSNSDEAGECANRTGSPDNRAGRP